MSRKSRSEHPALKGFRPIFTGAATNIVLVVVKISAGILGSSYAMIADGIESATDLLSGFVMWIGFRLASKAPDTNHPYGHGKAEPIAAAIVSLALFGAAVFLVSESVHHIMIPHPVPKTFTLYILGSIIIVKELLYRYVKKIGIEIDSHAMKAEAWHHRSDAISSVAAFIGISLAIIFGPRFASADAWAAIVASAIILLNAFKILKPAVAEMMDAAPASHFVQEVRKIAGAVEGVHGIDKCYVRKMGFDYYVDIHVEVDGKLTVIAGHEIAHRVKETLLNRIPNIYDVLVHIEPA